MSTIAFDTHKFVKSLQTAGVPTEQAEAFVHAQQEILAQALDSTLATRSDLERVERKLVEHDGKFTLLQWMLGSVLALAIANFAKQFF
jgi:hypothetical protein